MAAIMANEISQNQIVRVHADSAKDLAKLFSVAEANPQIPMGTPMRDRNLPASFFQPPDNGTRSASHSRESSIDQQAKKPYYKSIIVSNNGSTNQLENKQHIISQHQKLAMRGPGIPIAHSRAHSSPATLQKTTLSVVPQQAQLNAQNNQNTINQNTINQNAINQNVINQQQVTNQTVQQAVQTVQQVQQPLGQRLINQIQHIRQMSDINQIPLPEGWEEAVDHQTGRSYFINHNEKTTTWVGFATKKASFEHFLKLFENFLDHTLQMTNTLSLCRKILDNIKSECNCNSWNWKIRSNNYKVR